jgi:hypothetical protein
MTFLQMLDFGLAAWVFYDAHQRSSRDASLGWAAFVFFLPLLGLPCYLVARTVKRQPVSLADPVWSQLPPVLAAEPEPARPVMALQRAREPRTVRGLEDLIALHGCARVAADRGRREEAARLMARAFTEAALEDVRPFVRYLASGLAPGPVEEAARLAEREDFLGAARLLEGEGSARTTDLLLLLVGLRAAAATRPGT